jgi:rhodanese-related sulfurtransferase
MSTFRNQPVDLVVDVRSHLEYWLGHLPGAVCIPVHSIASELPSRSDVTPASRILVYCASGARSAAAAQTLESLGYRHVIDGGGMNEARQQFA